MSPLKSFASDNNSGAHPAIMEAIVKANDGFLKSYGDDEMSIHTDEVFKEFFGSQARIHYVTTGTAANVLGLRSVTQTYNSVLCAEQAHINNDECGAPEAFGGIKLVPIPSEDGKLTPGAIAPYLGHVGFVHASQPKVISITQPTELGKLYTLKEIEDLVEFAHDRDLLLHMDGARIANACAALDCSFFDMTTALDVDFISFGGTKNGCLLGEAVIFLKPNIGEGFQYLRKQAMQLVSKMRFVSAQLEQYLADDLWLKNARHANAMAQRLADKAGAIDGVTIKGTVDCNALFASIPPEASEILLEKYYFYVWDEHDHTVRWMTSWATTEAMVDEFVSDIEKAVKALS
ncbi:aminotransferase class V-fold PLP-dependent enzyme [Pseudodesulfovibrio sp. JC047]|uniref:threonine aldolase family protein n=1 Tax=Pseudodesulfovibrio sp. JC047 TaxID=2683199 RepID=UPI0013D595A2|nr:low specificity L-threonine aldolase [Pseudodesulfovibrio sp. JC047]NDV20742.1 aminotransferase class V-fold PLP-dependent enzyme [Pseudodesulfovibrio sp. JC047]